MIVLFKFVITPFDFTAAQTPKNPAMPQQQQFAVFEVDHGHGFRHRKFVKLQLVVFVPHEQVGNPFATFIQDNPVTPVVGLVNRRERPVLMGSRPANGVVCDFAAQGPVHVC